ncbi:integrin beta-PS [Nasonia vitripennis]|uniref:Integrin beta n=1 Tax=Nasonia vitripennis TaxID=7425 RepID=A0A7M7IRC8_NASVI|nr:integrin beta-PS [Nasonia vitripennis]
MSGTISFLLKLSCVFSLFSTIASAVDVQVNHESICAAQQTCLQCLLVPNCVWCSESRNNGSLIRCSTRDRLESEKDRWCPAEFVVAGKSAFEILENRPLHSKKSKDPVQVQPQNMRVTLRQGEELVIRVNYSKAEDYPVDLYYLMDLSFSMEPYRDQLSRLGDKLAEAMQKLTSNFRLGFGSFVDKVALPMTSTDPDMLKSPCRRSNGQPCASPYGYKNQMPLTENVALFKSRVQSAPVSGNLDVPEGGFDALMQAIVCTEKIGWRSKARHLLVFSTDASYHLAGDGRLAGIVEPNDEQCHLDNDGFYSYSLLQDYPSISQINRKASEQKINIIFAVPEHMNTTYQILTTRIAGSSIGLFENEAANVVSLVSKEYEKLVDSVTMTDNAPEMIDVRYFSKCLDENSKERETCDGLRVGNVVEFQVVLKAVDCPQNSNQWRQNIKIGPRGLTESLELDVELICSCPCEAGNKINRTKSPNCTNNGYLDCGICLCDDGFYGKQCECKGSEIGSSTLDACKATNDSDVCSGRGTCKCGVCDCAKRMNPQEEFYGTYCECDNFSCKRSGGMVCGGKGKCECGFCNCLPGWTGETCDCKESNSTCMPTHESSVVCSGKGDCICGSCQCHEIENALYSGQFCEDCPTCPGQQCEELKDCVECLAYKSGPLWQNNDCSGCSHTIEVEKVELLKEAAENDGESRTRVCRTPADGGCSLVFEYELLHQKSAQNKAKSYRIVAQKDKDCPKPLNVMGVALGVIISTVLLGFSILMIWKVVTMIHDRREFAKFEKERTLVRWERGDNPFYKKATTTFNNPTFKQNSRSQSS